MIKCKHCKAEKPEDQMSVWAGKPSKVCLECKKTHPTGKAASNAKGNGGGGDTSKKRRAAARPSKRAAAEPLEISLPAVTLPAFGVTARLTEEGYLQLTQDNDGKAADNVCLTRHEAQAIFDKFGEWIVKEAA